MKNTIILVVTILLGFNIMYSQSVEDTKEFIIEKIKANPPLDNYRNFVFFKENILKVDAEMVAGKRLTEKEYENIFIFGWEVYYDSSKQRSAWSVGKIIDIRDIVKVSTTKKMDKHPYYIITVYLSGKYYAKGFSHITTDEKPKWEYINKMEILISLNADAAQKIKKAIIHLGKLYGNNVKDGDIF